MTDNRSRPYRSHDPYDRSHGGQGHSSGSDPLAELARLIGQQNESYSGYRQEPARTADRSPHQAAPFGRGHPDPFRTEPDPFRTPADPYQAPPHPGSYSDSGQPYGEQRYADAQYNDPHYSDPRLALPQHPEPDYGGQDYNAQDYSAQGYNAQDYSAQDYAAQHYGAAQYSDQQYAAQQYSDHRGGQFYGDQPSAYPDRGDGYPQSYDNPSYGHDGQNYADPYYRGVPQAGEPEEHAPRRRGGLVTVLAVLALAVVGTAAAFGYRAVFGTSGMPIPPVIKADTAPAKVVPATQSGEASGKPIQDRVGGIQTERVVAREEKPVAPRVVFPGPNPIAPLPSSPLPPSASALAPASTASAAPVSTEPKKVRTVAIRPDQPGSAETASARAPATPAASRAAPAEEPARPTATRQQQPAPASSSAPLSLAPSGATASRPTMRTASAPAASTATTGSYSVQVTSQRSEAEAQSAFRALQAKFPSVLADRQMVVRRADLGDKGTYYRAQVPFNSQSEASEFCSSLKAAGGQCIVQRN